MQRFLTYLLTFVLLTVSVPPFAAQTSTLNHPQQTSATRFHKVENPIAGQYIVMLRDNTRPAEVSSVANTLARNHGGTVGYIYTDVFKGFSVRNMSEIQARKLSQNPLVKSVEENGLTRIAGQQPQPGESNVIKPLDRIDQRVVHRRHGRLDPAQRLRRPRLGAVGLSTVDFKRWLRDGS